MAGGCFWQGCSDWQGDVFVKKITKNAKLHWKYFACARGRKPCDCREPSPSSHSRPGARVVSQRKGVAGWAKALRLPSTIPLIAQPLGSVKCCRERRGGTGKSSAIAERHPPPRSRSVARSVAKEERRSGLGESSAIAERHPSHRTAARERRLCRRRKLRMRHAQ